MRSSTGTAKTETPRSTHPGRPGTQSVFSFRQKSFTPSKWGQEKELMEAEWSSRKR